MIIRDKLGRYIKGTHPSLATQFKRGEHPSSKTEFKVGEKALNWNGFRKGQIAPRKGKRNSTEHNLKLSKALKGRVSPRKGVHLTEETKIKISAFQQGVSIKEWNGYISPTDSSERNKFRRTIQREVFKRDDYTCQLCGKKGANLQVDHIQSWKDYIELRFNINNCRTLCMSCHYFITFGKPMPPTVRTWGHNFKEVNKNF
jgi:hypothetical protein